MKWSLLVGLLPLIIGGPALAQPPDPHAGHTMPNTPAAPAPRPAQSAQDPHAGHNMPAPASAQAQPPADPHAGHDMASPMTGAQLPVGQEPAPPSPSERAADRVYGTDAMQRARGVLALEHGGAPAWQIMADRLEYRSGDPDGYHWDAEAWYGDDLNRLVLKSKGEGSDGEGVEAAEVQALYSRAVARYTDVQIGVRQDLEPEGRTYLTVGFQTLLPYWFETEGALFLSDEGDLLARIEGSYDFRLTQRLILQPQAELNLAAQDTPRIGVGSGLSDGEIGLRLRYEIRREFAPYLGVSYERLFGGTADLARAAGEPVTSTRIVLGVRGWF